MLEGTYYKLYSRNLETFGSVSIDQYSNQYSLSGKKVLTDIEFGSMNVTGDVSGSKVKSVTISKGFIYGAAVVFTTIGDLPYIEI